MCHDCLGMTFFENVADSYDAARPSYPEGVFDALGPLEGRVVLDVGAGTGIASRQLLARDARVIAVDHGPEVLRRAKLRSSTLPAVVANGAALPVRSRSVELLCFAQAWHWLEQPAGVLEAHRVLRPRGRWAAWWSHARADRYEWFDSYWSAIERACPGTHRDRRDVDWGSTVEGDGHFDVGQRIEIPWLRQVSIDQWMTDQASHSYIDALPENHRLDLLSELRQIIEAEFPNQQMEVPHETWLWIAVRLP